MAKIYNLKWASDMKKIWIFLAGMGTGMVLLFVILMVIAKVNNSGVTTFQEPGEVIEGDAFEVFQVLPSGDALAWGQEKYYTDYNGKDNYTSNSIIVLLPCNEGKTYYDDQFIKIPKGKCARQIGVYKYTNNMDSEKTVPVVGIYDK